MAASLRATTRSAATCGKKKAIMTAPRTLPCFLFLVAALAELVTPTTAVVYKVGDSAGWTTTSNVSYDAWASSKTFRVGDTIVFVYNKKLHNVVEVSRADYRSCNLRSPVTTHATGNDSVTLRRRGHHFFLCGVPGHCALGLKVDVRVPPRPKRRSAAPGPAPAVSPAASSPSSSPAVPHTRTSSHHAGKSSGAGAVAPAPQKNVAATAGTGCYVMGWALVVLAAAINLGS